MSKPVTQKFHNLPIKKKLVLLIIGISCFTLVLASGVLLINGANYSKNTLLNGLNITASVLGEQSIAALEFMDNTSANDNLASLRFDKSLRIACLYDDNGELFAEYSHIHDNTSSNIDKCSEKLPQVNIFSDDRVSVLHGITRGEMHIGSIYIQSDLSVVEKFIIDYITYAGALILIALVLAYILSNRLQSLISTPIFDLVNTSKRLSENGDYTQRARKYGNDELGVLVDAFNGMLAQIQHRDEELQNINDALEAKVELRTEALQHTNKKLSTSLNQLRAAQSQLVQSEKMAALGGLVAGVAHEINTPVGVGVTAASHMELKVKQFSELYASGKLNCEDLEGFLKTISQSSGLIMMNLQRAAELIHSFKQLAVDQTSGEQRYFKLKQYIEEVLYSLQPHLRKTQHNIKIEGPENLELLSYPGAFSQIITNLVMNSITHGFENIERGNIVIQIDSADEKIQLEYTDNGVGIQPEHVKKVFDPFFTTKRGQGGSGLGMHIVYNLVAQTLGGKIMCHSEPGQGIVFRIEIPVKNQSLCA